jgi:hypothetical protein
VTVAVGIRLSLEAEQASLINAEAVQALDQKREIYLSIVPSQEHDQSRFHPGEYE